MKTSFTLFTSLVTYWLCIDGLTGDILCEVCSDRNDPSCLNVELKSCSREEPYCIDAYYKPSSDITSSTGRLIKQCGLACPTFEGTFADICKYCQSDKCNQKKNIDYYVQGLAKKKTIIIFRNGFIGGSSGTATVPWHYH